jgi:hypothetical protein
MRWDVLFVILVLVVVIASLLVLGPDLGVKELLYRDPDVQ